MEHIILIAVPERRCDIETAVLEFYFMHVDILLEAVNTYSKAEAHLLPSLVQ